MIKFVLRVSTQQSFGLLWLWIRMNAQRVTSVTPTVTVIISLSVFRHLNVDAAGRLWHWGRCCNSLRVSCVVVFMRPHTFSGVFFKDMKMVWHKLPEGEQKQSCYHAAPNRCCCWLFCSGWATPCQKVACQTVTGVILPWGKACRRLNGLGDSLDL